MVTTEKVNTIKVGTKELREAVNKAILVVPRRSTLPVLQNLKLDAYDGKLIVTANDLEKAIHISIPCEMNEEISCLVPRNTLLKFLNGENGKLEISHSDSKGTTLSREGLGEIGLKTDNVKDYTPMPDIPEDLNWHKIDAKWFCQMLGVVIPACACEESRPILTGALFTDGAMASADGFRLAVVKNDKLNLGLGDSKAIIPAVTLSVVKRLFSKEETIGVAFKKINTTNDIERVYFKSGNVLIFAQVIHGNFPNYEQLIPQSFECKASFSAPLMAQRLNMVDESLLASGITRLRFQRNEQNEHECKISCGIDELGEYNFLMPIKLETEQEGKIGVNIIYLKEVMRHFSLVNIELTSLSSPMKFTGDLEGVTIVVMPMFIQW